MATVAATPLGAAVWSAGAGEPRPFSRQLLLLLLSSYGRSQNPAGRGQEVSPDRHSDTSCVDPRGRQRAEHRSVFLPCSHAFIYKLVINVYWVALVCRM